ncbi:MAG: SMC-Scp complex subunit ScpB [Clostridia bacterium]|nr:SMC-Scp complex subunit ScpB [Clostridia bacterium]
MEKERIKGIIEAMLFAAGRAVTINELVINLELSREDIQTAITEMQEEYENESRGIEIVKVDEAYQLCTKKELYNYIYPIIDKRAKPNLSNAALETLAIIAYNPRIIRAQIEAIRGVNADGCIYKLLEYGLIEEAGKLDVPGKPMSYKTSNEFLKMFGYASLNDLPELPKYKLDENRQIVIYELIEEQEGKTEAPMPERDELDGTKKEENL